MSLNLIQDIQATEIGYAEPISLETAKAFCRVQAVSTAQDELFEIWITAARQEIEQVTGLSLVPKNIVAWLKNPQGGIELPGGPITDVPVFTNYEDEVLDNIETDGINFLSIASNSRTDGFLSFNTHLNDSSNEVIIATYTAGYSTDGCPAWAKNAILNQVSYYYENRGTESATAGLCPNVYAAVLKFSRKGILL